MSNTPTLFLDIDGVLNDHSKLPSGYCGITRHHAEMFNTILFAAPSAQLVISSAWRYLMLRGDMTLKGFECMMLVHGINCRGRLHGHTCADGEICDEPSHDDVETWRRIGLEMRTGQIMRYVKQYRLTQWAVVDDLPLRVPNFVRTDGNVGITEEDAERLIRLLRS